MTYEELFDAYREAISQRDRLAAAGDDLWRIVTPDDADYFSDIIERWKAVRGIGAEPPVEDWSEC